MSARTVKQIRSEFIGFFEKNGHTHVESGALVPQNDPTLMFTNSGMVPFKDVFTGKEKRDYTRATTAQKCVRAGGKHNDLENVGYTARHHTFFEMLGNFSFGDYFKEEAINYSWEMCTKIFELPPEKLCVTVHSSDEEAAEIWKKVTGFSDSKIIRIATDDNFWRMGDTGPCGPSTEIFYDHGEHIWGGPPGSAEEDGDRFIEIWNNVFMQYEQIDVGETISLPNPSIDTGMGLERMTATLMGSHDNYAIDIMRGLIEHVADLTSVDPDGEMSASHRVIADHIRCASFLMADGVMPSNEGRGYVLRRIMRRGMRHAHLLGAQDPLMYKLFPTLIEKMGEAYPELGRAESLITETLKSEEERFKVTLERGLKMLDEETEKLSGDQFPGDVAFKLYDTFGFPLDLTQDALRAKEIEVDTDAFDAEMAKQKAAARAAWKGSGDTANEQIWFEILDRCGLTEFLGYDTQQAEAQVLAVISKDGKSLMGLNEGNEGIIITNQTPFYAESGGQVGDTGEITSAGLHEFSLTVTDTRKPLPSLHAHNVKMNEGTLTVGDSILMKVDSARRAAIQSNHSVTHLLHEALREVLGDHVSQKGSLQDADRTRFDISHPKGVSKDEIVQVEAIVTEQIKANTRVITRVMPIDEARETGAMALFGEKYADEVRVVSMGTQGETKQFSVELCGGTHVNETGEIGAFKITSEGALSSGVRRLEAVTGDNVAKYLAGLEAAEQETLDRLLGENQKLRDDFAALSTAFDEPAPSNAEDVLKQNKKLQKQIADLRRAAGAAGLEDDVKEINGIKFIGKVLDGFPPKDLRPMAEDLKKKLESGIVALVATNDDKASIVVAVTSDLTESHSAVTLVKIGSEALGGTGGGGRPDMAQAGGADVSKADEAIEKLEAAV